MSSETPEEAAARVLAGRQWPVVIKLNHAINFAGEIIGSLEFRRGKMGDLKGVKLDGIPPIDQVLLIASRMCNQPIAALEMLEDEDGSEVIELALGFFGRCLGGGRKR